MAWQKDSKFRAQKNDFLSKAPAYPLLWPNQWPATHPDKRQPPKDRVTHFLVARDYTLNELRGLRASNILISTNIPVNQKGEPFLEYCDKKLDAPGVAVYFFVDDKPYVMACDAWEYPKDNLRAIGVAIGHIRATARTVSPDYLPIMLRAFSVDTHQKDFKRDQSIPATEQPMHEPPAHSTSNVEPTMNAQFRPEQQSEQKASAANSYFSAEAQAKYRIPEPEPIMVDEQAWNNPAEWWNIFGVSPDSGLSEVEAAFRNIARRTHPDRGGSADKMQILNEAIATARQQLRGKKTKFSF